MELGVVFKISDILRLRLWCKDNCNIGSKGDLGFINALISIIADLG